MLIRTNTRGFSLIELLITVTISSILISTAVPNFQSLVERTNADTDISTIYRLLQHTRTQAIVTQKRMTICGSDDGSTCSKKWRNYLLVFDDKNNDRIASADEIFHKEALRMKDASVKTRFGFGRKYVRFNALGQPDLTGSFIYCPYSGNRRHIRRLTWNRTGRPYLGRDIDNDGVIEDTGGKPISCT